MRQIFTFIYFFDVPIQKKKKNAARASDNQTEIDCEIYCFQKWPYSPVVSG